MTLTTLSLLRCISVTLANNQLNQGMFLLAINTRSPTTKLRVGMFHFLRVVMMGKYSRIHLCQNDSSATWTACYFRLFTMSPGFSTKHINKFGWAVPVSKWFGVNASKSLMSSLREVNGRPFMIASMAPFIHGLTGGLKFQLIFWRVNSASILFWSKLFSDLASSLWAPAKLVPLLLKMFFGCPLLEKNRREANIKLSVDRLPTSSIWTVPVFKQVKIAPYLLKVPSVERTRLPCLTVRGPN